MALATAVLSLEGTMLPAQLNVTGHVHYTEGPGGPQLNLNAVQTDQAVTIIYHFSKSGWWLPFMGNCLCKFQVFLERMGVGEFGDIPTVILPFNNVAGSDVVSVTIPSGTVPAGVYRIVARFMITPPASNDSPCVAFADLGFANWYQGVP